MKVGDTVYIEYKKGGDAEEAKISSIGRKYAHLERMSLGRFDIKTMLHDGGRYGSDYKVHLSKQSILDDSESRAIERFLSQKFTYRSSGLSLEKLRQIQKIVLS
jgi:hypothetical protein